MNSQWDTVVFRPEEALNWDQPIAIVESSGNYFIAITEDGYINDIDYYNYRSWSYEHDSEVISRGLTEW